MSKNETQTTNEEIGYIENGFMSDDERQARRHGMNCPERSLLSDDFCTCGLQWRDALRTEQEMHNAWRKRAEEAEEKNLYLAAQLDNRLINGMVKK